VRPQPDVITWLDTAILVRVDIQEDAWTLGGEIVGELMELPWRLVQVDRAGLRGVLELGDDAVARLGALTSAIEELVTVEVRDDVAVALLDASSAVERTAAAAMIGTAIAGAGGSTIGVFADAGTFGVAIERWRRDELAAALRTATSLSR
jgi:hypothetical protein